MNPQLSYKVLCLRSFTEKTFVGNAGETRICRICGKVKTADQFSHDSHAISASLGNKYLICLEECDDCNSKFSAIETDFVAYTQFSLFINRIPNRKGKMRKIEGRNTSISWEDDTLPIKDIDHDYISIHLRDWKDDKVNDVEEIKKKMGGMDFSKISYIPQNVYKALCKYVITSFPCNTEDFFAKTARWIIEKPAEKLLPPILIGISPNILQEPRLTIYMRNEDSKDYPLCFAKFEIADKQFVYIVPDSSSFSMGYKKDIVEQLWNRYLQLNPDIHFNICNFSSHTKMSINSTGYSIIDYGEGSFLEKGENGEWKVIENKKTD